MCFVYSLSMPISFRVVSRTDLPRRPNEEEIMVSLGISRIQSPVFTFEAGMKGSWPSGIDAASAAICSTTG